MLRWKTVEVEVRGLSGWFDGKILREILLPWMPAKLACQKILYWLHVSLANWTRFPLCLSRQDIGHNLGQIQTRLSRLAYSNISDRSGGMDCLDRWPAIKPPENRIYSCVHTQRTPHPLRKFANTGPETKLLFAVWDPWKATGQHSKSLITRRISFRLTNNDLLGLISHADVISEFFIKSEDWTCEPSDDISPIGCILPPKGL